MSTAESKAVFLSYASQDAEAARCICDALRGAGVEVWFDQSDLRGGDAWDAKIRKQIRECALFVPIISTNTQARKEGYFRLEWRLADQRTHLMSHDSAFLLPVVIDETPDQNSRVPDSFLAVQWSRVPDEAAAAKFSEHVRDLLGSLMHPERTGAGAAVAGSARRGEQPRKIPRQRRHVPLLAGIALTVVALTVWHPWRSTARAPAVSEAQKLVSQARALIDDDLMAVRENFRLAEELCQKAVALDTASPEAWATLARVSTEMLNRTYDTTPQRKEAARAQAERALRLDPASVEAGLAMAEYFFVTEDYAEAERRFRELLKRAPLDGRIARPLAKALANLNRADEATEIRLHHPAFAGRDPRPLIDEALALRRRGRQAEAEALTERAQALAPTPLGYRYKLAIVGLERDDLERAKAYLQTVPPAVFLEDAFASRAAQVYLRCGDGDKALEVLRRIPRELLEENGQVLPKGYLTGWALRVTGRMAAAEAEWGAALSVVEKRLSAEPNRPQWLRWKALLLALTKQRGEAEKTERLYLELMGRGANARPLHDGAGFLVALGEPEVAFLVAIGENEEAVRRVSALDRTGRATSLAQFAYGLRRDPWFAPLRSDSRVQNFIAEIEALLGPKSGGSNAAAPKSLAVLAFDNLSDDKANEYFSDGISDELINVLGRVPGLQVKGRTSAFYFKGKTVPAAEIAQQLGVIYLVRGSVRREGDTVRITAQLSRAQSDDLLWSSEPIERKVKDVFSLQEEIARIIAQNLSLKLGASRRPPEGDAEANRLVLEGRYHWRSRSVGGFARAEELFGQALKKDPTLAAAHASQAMLCVSRALFRFVEGFDDFQSDIDRARSAAASAVALDASSVEAHAVLAYASLLNGELGLSEQQFQRALSFNPHDPTTLQWRSLLFVQQGRLDLALAASKEAVAADPLSPQALYDHSLQLYYARQYSAGLEIIDRSLRLRPEFLPAHSLRAICLAHLGRTDEAVTVARKIRADPTPQRWLADLFALRVLRSANLREEADPYAAELLRTTPEGNFKRSLLMAILGRYDEALASARKIPRRPLSAFYFFWSGDWDPVRTDPRFEQILRTQGCVEEYRVARQTLAQMPTPIPAR